MVLDLFHFGSLGVPLFFLISGVVIPLHMIKTNYSHKRFRAFFLRRLMRVEPTFILALFCGALYLCCRDVLYGSSLRPSAMELFLHLGYLIPFFSDSNWVLPVFWTLAIEFQYYLFLALIFPCLNYKNRVASVILICAILGFSILSQDRSNLIYWLPIFFMGILYALYRLQRMPLIDYLLISFTCLGVEFFRDIRIGLLLVVALSIIHFLPNFQLRALSFLGRISYSLYLFHGLTGAVLINVASRYVVDPWLKGMLIANGVIFAILSAMAVYRFVEKPSHHLAKKIT